MTPRPFEPGDLDALLAISLATGHAGGDASSLYQDGRLMGLIYVAPYAVLAPELTRVLADDEGVAGYVTGALDTAAWEARLERDWWPDLRGRYPDPDPARRALWSADERRAFMIHHPAPTPAAVVQAHPAHLHLNLLPRAQGRGLGTMLLAVWEELAGAREGGTHVGVNRANGRGIGFWTARGFRDLGLDEAGRTVWMGRP